MTSERCGLSLVLFDEIEKAAPSMARLLLGITGAAALRLGDGTTVCFQNSLIFMTSNLGGSDQFKQLGLVPSKGSPAKRHFSTEFMNRVDATLTYGILTREHMAVILDQQIAALQQHVITRLGGTSFRLHFGESVREYLLDIGTSSEYGAREIKRTLHRQVTRRVAAMLVAGEIPPASVVFVSLANRAISLKVTSDVADAA